MKVGCIGFRVVLPFTTLVSLTLAACEESKDSSPGAAATSVSSAQASLPARPSAKSSERKALPSAEEKPTIVKQKLEDCPKTNTFEFEDPEFEAAVRFKLQKPKGDISKTDLKRLTSLNLSQIKLERLDLCVFHWMTGLKELFLGPGNINDLSPIAGATKLESLRASINPIEDITPLAKMTKMDRLDLGRTQVRDLTPLSEMKALTELMLDDTAVSDVTPLAGLEKLERLSLQRTRVKDVSALKNLEQLKFLYVAGAPVADDFMAFAPLRKNGTKIMD